MKTRKLLSTLLIVLGFASVAKAQITAADIMKEWERAKVYTKAYLDAMPESDYALKPTPQMRSFAEQMQHLTDANFNFASAISGEKPPVAGPFEKSADKSKATVTRQVLEGYDFVIAGIKKLTPAQLNEKIKLFGQFELSRQQVLGKVFEHQTHHRGQTTVYLRLAGVTPPNEQLF